MHIIDIFLQYELDTGDRDWVGWPIFPCRSLSLLFESGADPANLTVDAFCVDESECNDNRMNCKRIPYFKK